jgi:hypothetical protein
MPVLCQYCGQDTKLGFDPDYPFMHGLSICSNCKGRLKNGEVAPPYIFARSFYKDNEKQWNYEKPKEIRIFGIKVGEIK